MQSLYTTYAELYAKYSVQFGKKTAVFMLVGSFYELYDTQNPITGETALNIKEITDYLGIQISIHKEAAPNKQTGLVAGFPDYALHKWAGRLTSTGWTVAVVDQEKTSQGKVKGRSLARILSPSTHIENISAVETPFLTTLYFYNNSTFTPPLFGIASLDLTTGQTITYSGQATGRADFWTADTLVQNLSIFQPKEIVVYWHTPLAKAPTPQTLKTILSLPDATSLYIRSIETIGTFANELASTEYLRKAYTIKSLLPAREYLGLRQAEEQTALLFLLQFVEEHMPSMETRVARNEPWKPSLQLVCGNHALTQLQITSAIPTDPSVISLFKGSLTPMGRRGIGQRLLRPLTTASEIQHRLNTVEEIMTMPSSTLSAIIRNLRFCFDLPRLHRKVLLGTIGLQEFTSLCQTYEAITQIMGILPADSTLSPIFSKGEWTIYRAEYARHIDTEKAFHATNTDGDITPFTSTTYPQIAAIEAAIQITIEGFEKERARICTLGGLSPDSLRLEAREKEPFGIKGSRTQLQTFQKNVKTLPAGTHLSLLKSGGWIDTTELTHLNNSLIKLREELSSEVKGILMVVCDALTVAGSKITHVVEEWITHVDVTQAIAKTCQEKGFVKPIIINDTNAHVSIKGLRHPLVEGLRTAYTTHDIGLGAEQQQGYLIYGMNASGKSTLMKAAGVAVILAQAGCYVPAVSMELAPFSAIYTRILNHDNLFAGLSSFAVEMSELRDILFSADHNTLVLGDELCSGTESVSAEALVASGIQWLLKQSAKFIFATHLHHLPELFKEETALNICHLHVDYDPVTKRLIYDRSLRPGSGSSLYGLEVARAMDLPVEFIEQALQNRHRIIGSKSQSDAPPSSWNSTIVRRKCEICSSNIVSDLEVHHIEQRAIANKHGILPTGMSMNSAANLIVLCSKCHDNHHAEALPITPLIQTSDGPERIVAAPESESQSQPPQKRSKWTEEEMANIREILTKFRTISLSSIQFQLKNQYGIDISLTKLGEIRKGL